MKHTIYALTMFALAACTPPKEKAIDRHALVTRNNPEVTAMDSLSSLSVGNGEFAYTVDATGLQTFPEVYKTEFHWVHKANGDGTASEIPKTINRRKPWWSMTSATGTKSYMPPNPKNPAEQRKHPTGIV